LIGMHHCLIKNLKISMPGGKSVAELE